MEPPEVLKLLESNRPEAVEEAKKKFHEQFNSTRESWLLNGLVDYFISTRSMRCVDILVGVREPHDKYFFDKMYECLKTTSSTRLNVLTLLGHVVFRQPTWLYKISQHSLFKELLRILKTETDLIILISALLTLIVLLPMIPANVGPHLQEIFEVFSRLAAWNSNNPSKLPEPQLIHLQVSLHSLFHRLYGMYPCNFISYLRNVYSLRENLGVFSHTIKPMLETVKVHPLLVTASMESETTTSRWKTMEHHDVVVECAKLSAASKDESITSCFQGFRPRSESEWRRCLESAPNLQDPTQPSTAELKDFWSPSIHCSASTPPRQTPESSGRTSIPHTPITQTYVVSKFANQEGTSPPEAAIEATPETTPVKDSRHYLSPRPPPVNSTVARALNNFAGGRSRSSTSSTPSQSQPSSPMKKEVSPFRFPEGHVPGETNPGEAAAAAAAAASAAPPPGEKRKESIFVQRINSIFQDRLNVAAEAQVPEKVGLTARSPAKVNPPEAGDAASKDSSNSFKFEETSQEDQEVLEISRLGEQLRIDSSVPINYVPSYRQCDSVLQDFHPPHEEELEDCQQDIGSPCNSGGLHMPNSRSMLNFQQSVHRLRYYSQCGSDSQSYPVDEMNLSLTEAGTSGGMPSNQVRRAHSCPEIKKGRPSFSGGENLDELLELDLEKKVANGEQPRRPTAVSTATQTHNEETCATVYPYEHLFLGVFPPVEQQGSASNPGTNRYSPTTTLNNYIEIAAGLYGDRNQSRNNKNSAVQSLENELKTVRDQLVLSHLQLKFERQRREVHAERNRRLLGKSRNNRWLEDHNYALRDQLALLEKDIDSINKDLERNKAESRQNELKLQERIKQWQDKYAASESQNRELKSENERLTCELAKMKQQSAVTLKEFQQVQAMLFSVGNELKEATAQASLGEQLKTQIEYLQKELILMGEMQQKYRERIHQLTMQSEESHSIGVKYYVEEVKNLNDLVDLKTSSFEVVKNRVTELEGLLSKKDMLVADQKRALKTVKEEFQEQLEAVETKYKTQITINRKLEECVLELNSKLETSAKRGKRNISAAQDVLCLAERGGFNSPLSMSLSSSEGMSISGMIPPETVPARDLQSIVDEQETSEVPELEDQEAPPPPQQQ